MRSRPATPTASHVESCSALVTAGRRNDRLSPSAPRRSAAFAKARCGPMITRSQTRNRCGGQQSAPVRRTGVGGGRNARATRVRLHALPEYPPEIHPRESPAAAGSAAIIQQDRECPRFRCAILSARYSSPASRKRLPLVQKLWTMGLPCGRTWKNQPELHNRKAHGTGKRKAVRTADQYSPCVSCAGAPDSR